MTNGEIDYPELVNDALRGVAKRVLTQVAEEGLPGTHHFFITFDTNHPELLIPPALHDTYPEEMTIVLQNQFWDLVVEDDAFAVSLRFGGEPRRLRIPWAGLRSFVDPEAEFGLRFESGEAIADAVDTQEEPPASSEQPGEVISLDDFRKRDS